MMPLNEKWSLDMFVNGHRIQGIIRNGEVGLQWMRLMSTVAIARSKEEDES